MNSSNVLIKVISTMSSEEQNENSLIKAHIQAENICSTKNEIDKFHSYLFRDYRTMTGYKRRFKKYNDEKLFPYGTAILGVVSIMIYHNNPTLAYQEAKLICPHPQSLLACEAVIALFTHNSLEHVIKLLEKDIRLVGVCSPIETNVTFLPNWCRHYLLAAISGFMKWDFDDKNVPILREIYRLMVERFHPST